jgi:hypothetical protein
MWTMFKRYGVQLLLRAGVAQAEITRVAGVSERAIRRIRDEPPVETTDDRAARQARAIRRPSKAEAFRPLVEKLLEAEPELRSVEILRAGAARRVRGGQERAPRACRLRAAGGRSADVPFRGAAGGVRRLVPMPPKARLR